jgi:trigger factor
MQVTREDLNPCTVKLTVVCEPQEVEEGFSKALKQIAKQIRLPGFRPGHAPKAMVEQYVQKGELVDAAAEHIVRTGFKNALADQKLEPDPGTRPNIELTKLDEEEKACEFTVKVPLPPVVELGDYKGLPIERPKIDVSDEEVEYQIEEIRKRRSTREAITDRGVQEGDVAVLNIKAEGETGEGRTFMTIAGKTFPQLDQAIMGMRVEEMKTLDLTFPENFQEKDWAGKPMHVQVALNSVSSVRLPELDEEFAKSLQTESIDELRERVKAGIGRAKEDMVREMVTEQLLDRLLERSTVHVADPMWEQLAIRRLQETEAEQREKGKTLEEHAQENGMTLDELRQAWMDKAKVHVQRALMIREIFTREDMKLSNPELNQELVAMAGEYNIQPDEMLNLLKKNQAVEELHFRAISRKVADFLAEHADAKEVVLSDA